MPTDNEKNKNPMLQKDYSFLDALMQVIPNPIFYKDSQGIYQYCNTAFCNFLGVPEEKILGHTVFDLSPSDLADIYHNADLELIRNQGVQAYETTVQYTDGTFHDVIFSKASHIDEEGKTIGIVGIMLDITEQKSNERQIQKQNATKDVLIHISQNISNYSDESAFYKNLLERLMDVFDQADSGSVLEIDDSNKMLHIQASVGFKGNQVSSFEIPFEESFVWHHSKGNFYQCDIIEDVQDWAAKGCPKQLDMENNKTINSTLYIPIEINGKIKKIINLDSSSRNVFTQLDRKIAEYVRSQIPITHQLFTLYKKTLQLSRYDSLTGLMNRRYFEMILEDRVKIAKRHLNPLVFVMFDLDGLKEINDTYGHLAGDAYLKAFANVLVAEFREADHFARIGGDEFSGIFTDTDPERLLKKLHSVREQFTKTPIKIKTHEIYGRYSFGIAIYPFDGITMDDLMTRADTLMYKDKDEYKQSKK